MAKQTIGLGSVANDGTGDDLRTAGGKINDNFDELYTADGVNLKDSDIGTSVQAYSAVLDGTTASFTTADETKLDGVEASADVTDAGNVGTAINGATEKTTPIDADKVGLIDSAAANVLKWLSWANIKATLETYFDAVYAPASHGHAITDVTGLQTELDEKVDATGGDPLAAKATPVGTDEIVILDNAASGVAKRSTFASAPIPDATQTALDGKEKATSLAAESTAAVALVIAHDRQFVQLTHATPELTIDAASGTAYPAGMHLVVYSDNEATITAATGVSINGSAASSWTLQPSPAGAFILRTAEDTFTLLGDVEIVP